jgi:hypothetical protein
MLLISVGIEASRGISADRLDNWCATEGAGKSRISPLSEGPRLESNGNRMSPRLKSVFGFDGILFTSAAYEAGTMVLT